MHNPVWVSAGEKILQNVWKRCKILKDLLWEGRPDTREEAEMEPRPHSWHTNQWWSLQTKTTSVLRPLRLLLMLEWIKFSLLYWYILSRSGGWNLPEFSENFAKNSRIIFLEDYKFVRWKFVNTDTVIWF